MKIYKNSYEERLYSTGSDELDDLLERAFCDGYEYAQREFAGTRVIAQRLKQLEMQLPPKEYIQGELKTKRGRLKHVMNDLREIHGGVVSPVQPSDKSFYKAKTLSPKVKAQPRKNLKEVNWDWESFAKNSGVKK